MNLFNVVRGWSTPPDWGEKASLLYISKNGQTVIISEVIIKYCQDAPIAVIFPSVNICLIPLWIYLNIFEYICNTNIQIICNSAHCYLSFGQYLLNSPHISSLQRDCIPGGGYRWMKYICPSECHMNIFAPLKLFNVTCHMNISIDMHLSIISPSGYCTNICFCCSTSIRPLYRSESLCKSGICKDRMYANSPKSLGSGDARWCNFASWIIFHQKRFLSCRKV